jgi:hypothetical protein
VEAISGLVAQLIPAVALRLDHIIRLPHCTRRSRLRAARLGLRRHDARPLSTQGTRATIRSEAHHPRLRRVVRRDRRYRRSYSPAYLKTAHPSPASLSTATSSAAGAAFDRSTRALCASTAVLPTGLGFKDFDQHILLSDPASSAFKVWCCFFCFLIVQNSHPNQVPTVISVRGIVTDQ